VTRTHAALIGVIAAELAVGGYLVIDRAGRSAAPLPDLAHVDPIAAGDIRAAAADCRTPAQWAGLGELYLATGYFPEAEACYRRAAELAPADPDAMFKHGFALERLGRLEDASAAYESAAGRGHRRAADCWYYVGRNHLRLDRPGPAAEAFARAGDLPAARYELARLHARAGRPADAEAEVARLVVKHPDAYPLTSLRYRLALARDDRPAADGLADQFSRQRGRLPNPFDAEVDWLLGVEDRAGRRRVFREGIGSIQAGRFADAERNLRDALDAGWGPDVADRLAEAVFLRGRQAEAADVLAEATDRGGPAHHLLWRLGEAYGATGQPDKALAAWERGARLATGPGAKDLWGDLGALYEQLRKPERAKAYLARAALAAGVDALDAGRAGDAAAALGQAVGYDPGLADAWYYLGEAARVQGRPADARASYGRCLQINPDHGRALRALKLTGG
jgi:tetratricopeptide (TPR) repeat protein